MSKKEHVWQADVPDINFRVHIKFRGEDLEAAGMRLSGTNRLFAVRLFYCGYIFSSEAFTDFLLESGAREEILKQLVEKRVGVAERRTQSNSEGGQSET